MADVQHASLTADADLHVPKGAAAAAANLVYLSNGSGGGSFQAYPDAGAVGAAKGIVNKADDVGALTDNTTETPDDTIADASLTDGTSGSTDGTVADVTLTDSSGGTADGTLAAVSGSGDDTNINNNFAETASALGAVNNNLAELVASINSINQSLSDLADHINDIRTNLRASGAMA